MRLTRTLVCTVAGLPSWWRRAGRRCRNWRPCVTLPSARGLNKVHLTAPCSVRGDPALPRTCAGIQAALRRCSSYGMSFRGKLRGRLHHWSFRPWSGWACPAGRGVRRPKCRRPSPTHNGRGVQRPGCAPRSPTHLHMSMSVLGKHNMPVYIDGYVSVQAWAGG